MVNNKFLKHEVDYLFKNFDMGKNNKYRNEIINSQVNSCYTLPSYASDIMPKAHFHEITDILFLVKELNDAYAGYNRIEIEITLNGDPLVLEIQQNFLQWVIKYYDHRLKKTNSKDRDNIVYKFYRIFNELFMWFFNFCNVRDSIHQQVLGESKQYIPWYLYQNTWANMLSRSKDPQGKGDQIYSHGMFKEESLYCQQVISDFGFLSEGTLPTYFEKITKSISIKKLKNSQSISEKLSLLSVLASNLQEMRPFLIRNYKPSKSIISLAEDVYIGWDWWLYNQIGSIYTGESEKEIMAYIHKRGFRVPLRIDHSGILLNWKLPWEKSTSLDEINGCSPIDINIFILEAIHDKLYTFYKQINFKEVVRKFKSNIQYGHFTDRYVAASCHLIAEDESVPTNNPILIIKKLRSQQFFNLLENKLRCEVQSGKGSEITMYRKGGRKFRLGHHKRNQYVSSIVIKNILNRLSITPEEWQTAIGL